MDILGSGKDKRGRYAPEEEGFSVPAAEQKISVNLPDFDQYMPIKGGREQLPLQYGKNILVE